VLVAAGELSGLDQWAIDHAMPGARFTGGKPSVLDALIPLHHVRWTGGLHLAAELVTLPAAIVPATLLVALCCTAIGGKRGVALAALYVLGNAIEELTKSTLTRPALHHGSLHLAAFDNSYPSGHTLRAVLLAAAIGIARPRFRAPAAAGAVCVLVMLELAGLHVPSDIAGGLLLAAALLTAWAASSAWSAAAPSAPSRACRPSSRVR
jgi:membrane-associated phospholipid phosphatase